MFDLSCSFGVTKVFQTWWALFFEPNYIDSDYILGE
jgi:hypothetical protein